MRQPDREKEIDLEAEKGKQTLGRGIDNMLPLPGINLNTVVEAKDAEAIKQVIELVRELRKGEHDSDTSSS